MKLLHLLACSALCCSAAFGGDPVHEFDFWIGEWSVQNRYPQPDGSWKNGDVTRARITPVCGGRALLEEWAGDFQGTFMNGFSLRAYDPGARNWNLILAWTTDGNVGFGNMHGTFRHGRCELYGRQPVPRPDVRAYASGRDKWESWSLSESEGVLRRSLGSQVSGEPSGTFLHVQPDGVVRRERLLHAADGSLRIEESVRRSADVDYEMLRETELRRE